MATRRILSLGVLTLAAVLGTMATFWVRSSHDSSKIASARIALDQESYNWGKLAPSSRVETVIKVSNKGTSRLTFGEVGSSCGCTRPVLPISSLGSGESTILRVQFDLPDTPGPCIILLQSTAMTRRDRGRISIFSPKRGSVFVLLLNPSTSAR